MIAVLGDAGVLDRRAVAMVGGRNASANGQRMAETLAADLAAAGLVVVSGLARGIDAAAHRGALRDRPHRRGGRRRARLPYPPEHADLQRADRRSAAQWWRRRRSAPRRRRATFPRRNRIIAGLSLGVVVVEAAPRSGSLITARLAQEAGREVFAVPGSPLDPRAAAPTTCSARARILTESAADVLDNLPDHPVARGHRPRTAVRARPPPTASAPELPPGLPRRRRPAPPTRRSCAAA